MVLTMSSASHDVITSLIFTRSRKITSLSSARCNHASKYEKVSVPVVINYFLSTIAYSSALLQNIVIFFVLLLAIVERLFITVISSTTTFAALTKLMAR